jgi:hypothetical protein
MLKLQFNIKKNKSTKVPSLQQVFKLYGELKIKIPNKEENR